MQISDGQSDLTGLEEEDLRTFLTQLYKLREDTPDLVTVLLEKVGIKKYAN